jgi:hypothetical protein
MSRPKAKYTPLAAGLTALAGLSALSYTSPPVPKPIYSHCGLKGDNSTFSCEESTELGTRNPDIFTYKVLRTPGRTPGLVNEKGCSASLTSENAARCHQDLENAVSQRNAEQKLSSNLNTSKKDFNDVSSKLMKKSSEYENTKMLKKYAGKEINRVHNGYNRFTRRCPYGKCEGYETDRMQHLIRIRDSEEAFDKLRNKELQLKKELNSLEELKNQYEEKFHMLAQKKYPTKEQYNALKKVDPSIPNPFEQPNRFEDYKLWCLEHQGYCAAFPLLMSFGLYELGTAWTYHKVDKSLDEAELEKKQAAFNKKKNNEKLAARKATMRAAKLEVSGKGKGSVKNKTRKTKKNK